MSDDTLAQALEGACTRWADRPALTVADRTLSYAELGRRVGAVAGAYATLGVERGERIVCQLPGGIEHLVAAAAAWRFGAVHVAADHQLTGAELSAIVEVTGAGTLLAAPVAALPDPLGPIRSVRRRHPELRIVGSGIEAEGTVTLPSADAASPAGSGPHPDDVAAIFTTSGTTGRPKAPVGLHGRLVRSWTGLGGMLGLGPDDVYLGHLPLSHGLGLMLATSSLLRGAHVILRPGFSAREALELVESAGVTVFPGAPAHYRILLARREQARRDLSSLRIGIASAGMFDVELLRAIRDELGIELLLMYGASEGVGVMTTSREDMLAGSVGRPDPGSVAIVDDEHRELPPGGLGEIAFSRAHFPVRYWGRAQPVADGWYYTGDLGRLDDSGRLHVVGRLTQQINRGGLKVDPAEVEAALRRCDGVLDAAVLGLPDPILGEIVCACVVPAPSARPSLVQLRSELARELAATKLPEELCVLGSVPRTGLGKVDMGRLRAYVLDVAREQLATT